MDARVQVLQIFAVDAARYDGGIGAAVVTYWESVFNLEGRLQALTRRRGRLKSIRLLRRALRQALSGSAL
jgi:hypothetical protein